MEKSEETICCNECRAGIEKDPKLRDRKCLRCDVKINCPAPPWHHPYCLNCSRYLNRCYICGRKVAADGAQLPDRYVPSSFEEARDMVEAAEPGDLILVVMKKYDFKGCGWNRPSPDQFNLYSHSFLGLLGERPFTEARTTDRVSLFAVKTRKYVLWSGDSDIKLGSGMFPIGSLGQYFSAHKMDRILFPPDSGKARMMQLEIDHKMCKANFPLEIVTGGADIEAYCCERRDFYYKEFLAIAARKLGIQDNLREAVLAHERELKNRAVVDLLMCFSPGEVDREELRRAIDNAVKLGIDRAPWALVLSTEHDKIQIDVPDLMRRLKAFLEKK